jgi:hypothetical protein
LIKYDISEILARGKKFPEILEFMQVSGKSMQTNLINGRIPLVRAARFLFFLLFSLQFALDAQSQNPDSLGRIKSRMDGPIMLSPRVGADLDSVEVEYFNIFPDLDRVKSVVYRKDNLDNLLMVVSMANGKDTILTFSALAAQQLTTMIDQFERLPDNPGLVNWKLLPGYNPDRFNFFENTARNLKITTDSGVFSGRTLMASDTMVCLWLKKGSFDPADFKRFVRCFSPGEIQKLEVKPSISSRWFGASIGAGLGIGILQLGYNVTGESNFLFSSNSIVILGVGAAAGSVCGYFFDGIMAPSRRRTIGKDVNRYLKFKDKLRSHAMFKDIFPPELRYLK